MRAERGAEDLIVKRIARPVDPASPVVIVEINESSIRALAPLIGRWPLLGFLQDTIAVLAIISRRPMTESVGPELTQTWTQAAPWWRPPADEFKQEIDWLHRKSEELLEIFTLPVLHVLASALNFTMILVTGKPVFRLPVKNVKEVMEKRQTLSAAGPAKSKAGPAAPLQPDKVVP